MSVLSLLSNGNRTERSPIRSTIIHCAHYQHSDWPRAPAYFENSCDFADKHDYSIICYPIISADYTVRSAQCAQWTEERESCIIKHLTQ